MITQREKQATLLSPTKKDYYQIWNELLETASKLSERWDPTNTNESDPGIVLLKMLTAIADKLNYNIDKNTLEAFMPSASQEQSMRKLCQMMGYNMKYYQSATTRLTIAYLGLWDGEVGSKNTEPSENTTKPPKDSFVIPRHTNITDKDKSINYFTLTDLNISKANEVGTVEVMQGQLVECEPDNNYLITLANLDDNNRYYLPQTQIAQNGVFVEGGTVFENAVVSEWSQVDNLYARQPNNKVFKFGYDSKRRLPYIQFPETIAQLIGTGLTISYVRTAGIYGNISANALSTISANKLQDKDAGWEITIDDTTFNVFNANAATNGADKESIDQAYNSYKKTVGTFDTLVTCRDYMNAIYNLTQSAIDTSPLLSNVNVTDIRDDINKALTICSFDSQGIIYNQIARANGTKQAINSFDLIIYPFKTIYNNSVVDATRYNKSFQLDTDSATQASIRNGVNDNKTVAHHFLQASGDDIVAIKNYYQLNAQITTVRKVNVIQETDILTNIHQALYKAFNMRNLDFGEQIPFDSILDVIKNADERIRNVSLQEPTVLTSFLCGDGTQYDNVASGRDNDLSDDEQHYNIIYNKLALRNILAGRIALFNYNTDFVAKWDEAPCAAITDATTEPTNKNFAVVTTDTRVEYKQPNAALSGNYGKLKSVQGIFQVDCNNGVVQEAIKIKQNEAIQFSTVNYKTTKTYPAYVNYYLYLSDDYNSKEAAPATFMTLGDFLDTITRKTVDTVARYPTGKQATSTMSTTARKLNLQSTINFGGSSYKLSIVGLPEDAAIKNSILYIPCDSEGTFTYDTFNEHAGAGCACGSGSTTATNATYRPSDWGIGLPAFYKLITSLQLTLVDAEGNPVEDSVKVSLQGIFRRLSSNLSRDPGYCIDQNLYKYMPANSALSTVDPFYGEGTSGGTVDCYWVQNPAEGITNQYGLGVNGTPAALTKDTQHQLKENELLFINYTPSGTDEEGNQVTKSPIYQIYGQGTVIKPNFNILKSNVSSPSKPAFAKQLGEGVSNAFSGAARINGVPTTLPTITDTGMYSFGAQQQVEIREPMIISIGNQGTAGNYNFYWQLQNTGTLTLQYQGLYKYDGNTKTHISVGSIPAGATDVFAKYHRFMKSGEYFFFTDRYKTQMAYYGDGSQISYYQQVTTEPDGKPWQKAVDDEGPAVETILEEGIRAVPWLSITLDANKFFTVTEYRYVTLAEDDTLLSLTVVGEGTPVQALPSIQKPIQVDMSVTPTYSFKDGEGAIESLPNTPGGWYVGTRLSIQVGPNNVMTLRSDEKCRDKMIFTYKNGDATTEVALQTGAEANTPLSLKLNSAISSPTGSITISPDSTFEPKAIAFEQEQLVITDNGAPIKVLAEGNKLDNWTQFTLGTGHSVDLYANIPNDNFGLFALYIDTSQTRASTDVTSPDDEEDTQPAAVAQEATNTLTLSSPATTLKQFLSNDEESQLLSLDTAGKLYIIKISASTTLTLTNNTDVTKTVIISPLDIVDIDNNGFDVNTIDYRKTTLTNEDATGADQLLFDLQEMFVEGKPYATQYPYLNGPIESDLAININTLANPPEKLSDARIWYDYNNINNNFVISQIDTSYLYDKTTSTFNGIVLTRSSKL